MADLRDAVKVLNNEDPILAFTQPEKAFCILEFANTESLTLWSSCFHALASMVSRSHILQIFLWGFVKELVYVLPHPKNVNELKA